MKEKKSLIDILTNIGDKVSDNKYLQALSQGCMTMLPVVIVGSFASLGTGLPLAGWQEFLASTGLNTILSMIVNGTTNMLGVWFTLGIAMAMCEKFDVKGKLAAIMATVSYFALLPVSISETGYFLSFDYTGTKGMIVGIILAMAMVKLYKAIVDANIVIKMPAGTPEFVSNSFVALIPAFVIAAVIIVLRLVFNFTPWGNAFDCLYSLLQMPLQNLVGTNLISNLVIQFLTQLCWAFGIHPGFISSATGPIFMGLDGMNQAAYAAGQPVPNIIGMAFSYSMTVAALYPAFAVAVLIFSKSKQLKTVGKIAVAPAFFGISEPLMFGVPVVMNPILAIPWIVTPMVNFLVGYLACSMGLAAPYVGVMVFNFPMCVTGLLNGSLSLVILEIVVFIIDILIYAPFIKIQDKKYIDEKTIAEEA